jgi:branched-chain amino acid transport system permease protein
LSGLVFALIAIGLTLVYGVMEIVNFAHGEFLMLAMYASLGLASLGLGPLLGLPLVVLAMFFFGFVLYRIYIRRLLTGPPEAQIFGTFGLLVLLQGIAQFAFSSDYRGIPNPPFSASVRIGSIALGGPQIAAAIGAILITALLVAFIEFTETGRALRALAEDRMAATLMGIDVERMNAFAFGLGAACTGAAGALLMLYYQVHPRVGAEFALTAFVVVALGGFGSMRGALVAAVLVGLVEVLAGFYLSPAVKMIPVYALYLIVVLLRPQGLLGRR